jgi:hypothetical protein
MVVTTPSPQARFLAIKHVVDAHRELLQRQDLQIGLDYAQQQLSWKLTEGGGIDANNAAARLYMLKGAHEFVRIFKTLTEVPKAPAQTKGDEMDHSSFK